MIKDRDLIFIGAVAVGGYFLYKAMTGRASTSVNADLGGIPSGFAPSNEAQIFQPSTQTTVPVSADFQAMIFTPTAENAADRFIVAPGSGGGGVYDRYAQQSIRKEYANQRAIFGTPGVSQTQPSKPTNAPSESIKKLFKEGLNPQSVMK